MRDIRWWLAASVLVLAACGGGSNNGNPMNTPTPNVSPGDLQSGVKNYQTTTTTALNQASAKLGKLFNNFPSKIISPSSLTQTLTALAAGQDKHQVLTGLRSLSQIFAQSTGTLPRGIYDCTSGTCPKVPTSSPNLVVKWIPNSATPATLTLVWGSTVQAHDPDDITHVQELPSVAEATLVHGSATVMDLKLSATWHASTCVNGQYLIDVPDSLKLSGFIKDSGGVPLLDLRDLELNVGDTAITTQGDLTVTGDSGSVSNSWTIRINGTLVRNPKRCGAVDDFKGSSVDFDFKTSTNSGTTSAELKFSASNFDAKPPVINISGGYLNLGGKVVTFQGILDDANGNCVPGENVTLTFSGGQTQSLEAFLIAGGAKTGNCTKQ